MKTNSPTRQSKRKASLVTLTAAQLKKGVTVYGQGGGGGSGKASRRGEVRGNAPYMRLYRAAAAYAKSKGGLVIVAGGVTIAQESKHRFTIGVVCTGRIPPFADHLTPSKP